MVIAALVSFGALLVAWILAPERAREQAVSDAPLRDAEPIAA